MGFSSSLDVRRSTVAARAIVFARAAEDQVRFRSPLGQLIVARTSEEHVGTWAAPSSSSVASLSAVDTIRALAPVDKVGYSSAGKHIIPPRPASALMRSRSPNMTSAYFEPNTKIVRFMTS